MKIFVVTFLILVLYFGEIHGGSLKILKHYLKNEVTALIERAGGKTQCAEDLKSLAVHLIHGKKWAWEMFDASAKLQSGIIYGNLYHVGNYDQCLKIRSDNETNINIQGKYCTVVLLPSANFTNEFSFLLDTKSLSDWTGAKSNYQTQDLLSLIKYTFGVCIPRSCSIGNLQKIWDYIEFTFGSTVHVLFVDLLCSYEGKVPFQFSFDKYIFGFFGVMIALVVFSTFYDYFIHQNGDDDKRDNYLMIFSAYTNSKRLFTVRDHRAENQLSCLNGLKVFSMLWVIYGHRVMFNIFSGNINGFEIFSWRRNFENILILGSSLSVDNFLLISGLLLSYLFFKSYVTKKQKVTVFQLYFFRLLRLSPALLAVVLFYIGILKYLNDGPAWAAVMKKMSGSCAMYWWSTLLYITNFMDIGKQCMEQSWYLAVDTQLYFISPLILFNLVTHPKRTIVITSLLSIGIMIYTFIITIQNNYGALYFEGNKEYHVFIYQPTLIRSPVWIMGVLFGYILFKYPKVRIPKFLNMLLWIYVVVSMFSLMYSHLFFTRNEYNPIRSATYNALARPFWAFSLCLLIFSCINGHGGIVNKILSLRLFTVLVRLSYSFYLSHIVVGVYLVASKRAISHFSNTKNYHDFIGDVFFNFPPSLLLYLIFEAPFINLSKLIATKNDSKSQMTSNLKPIREVKEDEEDDKYLICVYQVNGKKKKKIKKYPIKSD